MFALSFLIVTAIIGAGFATGAELLAFFGKFALPPVLIALLVGIFLFAFMITFLLACERNTENSKFHKVVFNALYFIFYTAMIAGIAELNGQVAAIISIALCIAIVFFGFERLLAVNYILAAAILVVLLWVGVTNISPLSETSTSGFGSTVLSALFYSAMNCCMIEQLFRTARKKFTIKEIILASLFAACIVAFFVMLLLTAIRSNDVNAALPVLALNNSFATLAVICLAILSSMYVALFNLAGEQQQKSKKLPSMIYISICAYICSLFGFTEIINTLYPLVGVAITIYALWLIISFCFLKKRN